MDASIKMCKQIKLAFIRGLLSGEDPEILAAHAIDTIKKALAEYAESEQADDE